MKARAGRAALVLPEPGDPAGSNAGETPDLTGGPIGLLHLDPCFRRGFDFLEANSMPPLLP